MINKRLTWFLESNNHISCFKSGFRSDHSTTDNLVRFETFIRDAFIKKEHVVAVFFYLEKAYDQTWRYGILKDIYKLGLIVRGDRDSRANLMPIYGDLYQIKL